MLLKKIKEIVKLLCIIHTKVLFMAEKGPNVQLLVETLHRAAIQDSIVARR